MLTQLYRRIKKSKISYAFWINLNAWLIQLIHINYYIKIVGNLNLTFSDQAEASAELENVDGEQCLRRVVYDSDTKRSEQCDKINVSNCEMFLIYEWNHDKAQRKLPPSPCSLLARKSRRTLVIRSKRLKTNFYGRRFPYQNKKN